MQDTHTPPDWGKTETLAAKWLAPLLWAMHTLLLFLLAFQSYVQLPLWLQVGGRLHPLLLHFPLVLALLSLLLTLWPGLIPTNGGQYPLLRLAWLATALAACATALSGFFLSLEGGYEETLLQQHTWAGMALAWGSAAMYAAFAYLSQTNLPRKILASALGITLLAAGHLGASLTHGQDFLWAPLQQAAPQPTVAMEEALAFDHVVKPLIEQKCLGCHNPQKSKGNLQMTHVAQLLQGGDSGPALVAGDPANSLLLQRIHLPPDHKEHMPPKGKPQLTPGEVALLEAWIMAGAPGQEKIMALQTTQPFFQLAAQRFAPAEETMPLPDPHMVAALNNEYRRVAPLAMGKPGLEVTFFQPAPYQTSDLQALEPLRGQLLQLNLARLPLNATDLETIARFSNLRKLNLSFAQLNGEQLAALSSLQQLNSLNLAGTAISAGQLASLLTSLPRLTQVFLWETAVSAEELSGLQAQFPQVTFEAGIRYVNEIMALNPPIPLQKPSVAQAPFTLALRHPIQGVAMYYTLDGSVPDSTAARYEAPIPLHRTTTVKVRAYKPGWQSSQVFTGDYLFSKYTPDSVSLISPPAERYKGNGAKTLFDRQKGDLNHGSGRWLGYRDPFEALVFFSEPIPLEEVALSFQQKSWAWAFPPARIEIWTPDTSGQWQLGSQYVATLPEKGFPEKMEAIALKLPGTLVDRVKIVALPVNKLPFWHSGKGEKAWLFMDELLFN